MGSEGFHPLLMNGEHSGSIFKMKCVSMLALFSVGLSYVSLHIYFTAEHSLASCLAFLITLTDFITLRSPNSTILYSGSEFLVTLNSFGSARVMWKMIFYFLSILGELCPSHFQNLPIKFIANLQAYSMFQWYSSFRLRNL